jgi:hypothetical protein
MDDKLTRLLKSYRFLVEEYQRVVSHGLLANAVAQFRSTFDVGDEYTDVKVIDSLIWKFVSFAGKDALRERKIIYQ